MEEFVQSMTARGFSEATVLAHESRLERLGRLLSCFVWEVSPDDVDNLLVTLGDKGIASATRRAYLETLMGFHRFLAARKTVQIEAWFGTTLGAPIDEFNGIRHVADDSPSVRPPPSAARLEDFFGFLSERIERARKYASAARDYALFRTLYLGGLRVAESCRLEVTDVHLERGPFGKLHVRFGKGAKTSGPRPRWVPMLDQLDLIMRWFLDDVRPLFRGAGPALFPDESGGELAPSTVRNRLAYLLKVEGRGEVDYFSPHDLRRACATRNYERGVDLVAIQQMLGHWHIGTTMRYVRPSSTFVEDAYRRAISATLEQLSTQGEEST
jgi:site-specific recombinase XerD